MSRNLCQTSCHFCGAEKISIEEEPRLIYPAEAGVYYDEYKTMHVANAHCPDCEAKYLAWFCSRRAFTDKAQKTDWYTDLSFRSTFNDEHGADDLPLWEVQTVRRRVGPYKGAR